MKILQICKKNPVPPIDGETIAIHQLSKQLVKNEVDLTVLAMETEKHPLARSKERYQIDGVRYFFEKVNTQIHFLGVLNNLFSDLPYIVERFYQKENEVFSLFLAKILKDQKFDIVQLEGVFLVPYISLIRKYSKAKIVLRAHNVEHKIWERLAENETSWAKKFYLNYIMNPKFKQFEIEALNKVSALVAISEQDETFFKEEAPNLKSITIPVGAEIQHCTTNETTNFSLGFIGDMQWQPNREGVDWFLKNVLQQLNAEKITFNLAGRNAKNFNTSFTNFTNYGEVTDAAEFMNQQSIFVVPLLSGSGMKVKIIEAMSLGKCVLTTSIGAEGIATTQDGVLFIYDTPAEWIDCVSRLQNEPELVVNIGKSAQQFVQSKFNIDALGKQLVNFYKELI